MSAVRKPDRYEPPQNPEIKIIGYITEPTRTGYVFTIDGVPYEIDMPEKIDKSAGLSPAQHVMFDLQRQSKRIGILEILLRDDNVKRIQE